MIQKKIMKIIRGKATPLQVFLACLAGAVLGFLPPPLAAPGLFILSLSLLFILNANLFIATAVFAGATLLSILLEPLVFELGLALIESPLRPLFAAAANTPVLALMGLDNYSAVGGLTLGVISGAALGLATGWALIQSRKALALLEKQTSTEGSAAQKILKNPLVKVVTLVCLGGIDAKGNAKYEDLARKKFGLPVRPLGIVALVLILGLTAALGYAGLNGSLTAIAKQQLEQANGATVDLDNLTLDLAAGSATITNIAFADPSDLDKNTFEAERIEIDIANADLLTKRIALDRVEVTAARHATTRATPGRLTKSGEAPPPGATPPPGTDTTIEGGTIQGEDETDAAYQERAERLDRLLANANDLIDKARQISRVVDTFNGTSGVSTDASGNKTIDTASLKDAKRREAQLKGYYKVTADHLLEGAPRFVLRELVANDVTSEEAPDDAFNIRATNLSTDPATLAQPASVTLTSRSGNIDANLQGLGGGGSPDMTINARNIKTADLFATLSEAVQSNLQLTGGTADLAIDAKLPPASIDASITVTLYNMQIDLPDIAGKGGATIDQLPVAITAVGPITAPAITIDDKALQTAIADAVGDKAINRATEELDKLVGDKVPEDVKDKLDKVIDDDTKDKAKKALRGLFGNDDDDDD